MHTVLLLGAGKIGRMIARFLASTGDYHVRVADVDPQTLHRLRQVADVEAVVADAARTEDLAAAMRDCQSVISALNGRCHSAVAEMALQSGASYFDLTGDIETGRRIREVARQATRGQVFVPHCGLAPGFIAVLARHLTKAFDALDTVHMRVGALPQFPSNALSYNLTWSTDGLINEYCNPCDAIQDGRRVQTCPLEGLEMFVLDGIRYEAFNTSGGAGTLCETLEHQVRELNYRTIRHAGHRDLMAFLINDLRLGQRRNLLKDILEYAIPVTFQDVVVIFCNVTGWRHGQFMQLSDTRKIYEQTFAGEAWSAIQVTTAASICAVLDLHVSGQLADSGFVKQEDVDYDAFIHNRFVRHYLSQGSLAFGHVAGDVSHPDIEFAA
jgi:saccharopine dehydrogenase-like NADP-dependent oxidoreductase